ncbi:MAG: glycosyltransferase family 9 protein [Bacteroidetes bacterium]|nr:glycosyltransferase family 9 protein [Bacteroidota bacterium]
MLFPLHHFFTEKLNGQTLLISRTDSIGDVILTLPLVTVAKQTWPGCRTVFLCREYAREVVACCSSVDEFLSWDSIAELPVHQQVEAFRKIQASVILHVFPRREIFSLARKAGIPLRIAGSTRIYPFYSCNRIVWMTRKRSDLHEAQLNLKLLQGLGIKESYSTSQIPTLYHFDRIPLPTNEIQALIDPTKFNLVLHPKSKGSAREWGTANFKALIHLLPAEKYKIFITGTKEEGDLVKDELIGQFAEVVDLTGRFSLRELIAFLSRVDGLIAASTGPLHIAAALGKKAIGIYPPIRPMHPGRWEPLGEKASFVVLNKTCSKCRHQQHCECMEAITPEDVYRILSMI